MPRDLAYNLWGAPCALRERNGVPISLGGWALFSTCDFVVPFLRRAFVLLQNMFP